LKAVRFIASAPLVTTSSACPSAGWVFKAVIATMLAAPGRLSNTTGRPRLCESFSP
jgi:hypothetical protein